ncbi:MAG: AAA family ATPase [Candidatus Omnitrophica bacterium]|nr:AAA family ATPase [Candidatus Omnitrophota bacterium]
MYLDFYKLKENPFNVTSDPGFLFLSHTHREALDHLIYGIENRKGFIEITGEIGAGKTTLCRALMNRFDGSTRTSLILNPALPEKQLLEAIIEDFGITPLRSGKAALIKSLNSFLLEQLSAGNNAVLIIDEAQNLKHSTLEAIRMLSNLETEKEKLLQIILVGQPDLETKLRSPKLAQLRQRVAVRSHVRALDRDEVDGYIEHRISVAGPESELFFSPEAISSIFEFSGGIPRLINIVCDKALLVGYVREAFQINGDILDESIEELEGKYKKVAAVS